MATASVSAQTIASTVELTGIGLHSGLQTTLRLQAAPAGHGIVFTRADLPGRPAVAVTDVQTDAAPHRTAIKKGAAEVHTVEHLLSALSALGVTDCAVEIDGLEVPGMDGSAGDFVAAIQRAGLKPLDARASAFALDQAVTLEDGMARVCAMPHAGGLKITYTLNYPGHALAQGSYEIEVGAQSFVNEIARARTFAIRKDAEAMRAAGLGKGANLQNTVIVDGERAVDTALRFPNEPVRHKILDLIGDLYVLGGPIHAHIVAKCTGHRHNRELVKRLRETNSK